MGESNKKKVSIIVPCYNVEQYIDRCVESVVNQTIGMDSIELILVNDASTDQTLHKLKSWEEKYPEDIMVITYDKNMRQGGAKNIGLLYATAEYIGYVDADDWIEPNMYELLLEPTFAEKYDVVRGKFIYAHNNVDDSFDNSMRRDVKYYFKSKGKYYYGDVTDKGKVGNYGTIPTGIYRRDMLVENEILFPENIMYEDNLFIAIMKLYVKSLYIVDYVVYHYCQRIGSTTHTRNFNYRDRMVIEEGILEEYIKRDMFSVCSRQLERDFLQRYYLNTLFMIFTRNDDIPGGIIGEMKETICWYFPDFMNEIDFIIEKMPVGGEKALMMLLKVPGEIPEQEMKSIKREYLLNYAKSHQSK